MAEMVCLDGTKVKAAIDSQELKLWWLAERAGIHRTTLRRWIKGDIARVNRERAGRLGEALGVSLSELGVS